MGYLDKGFGFQGRIRGAVRDLVSAYKALYIKYIIMLSFVFIATTVKPTRTTAPTQPIVGVAVTSTSPRPIRTSTQHILHFMKLLNM